MLLVSSLEDMYKWDQALNSEKLVTKQTMDSIFTAHVRMQNLPNRAHGYGWFIDKRFDKKLVEYSGSLIGFLSKYIRFINDKIIIIILKNVEDFNQFCKICDDMPAIIFDR